MRARTIGLAVAVVTFGASAATASNQGWRVMVQHRISLHDSNPTNNVRAVKTGGHDSHHKWD